MATLILNFVFQAFQIGSNLWLTKWSNDKNVANDTGLRDMYLGVYGAFGFGQGKSIWFTNRTVMVLIFKVCLKEKKKEIVKFVS